MRCKSQMLGCKDRQGDRTDGAESVKINALVDNTKASIYRVYRELQERDNYVTAEKVKNVFLGIESKHQTLLELFDRHNEKRKELIGVNVAKSTYYDYCNTRQHLSDFVMYRYNLHDVPFKDVNHNFLSDFEVYLLTRCQSAPNTITKFMKKLRHIVGIALKNEWRRLWIKGRRNKTDTEYNIPILNTPAMILEKYRGQAPDNRVL
ncbi:MAG: site-specific integrase, partial [Prevotellaceae bacterium]|nr:site-specific integrase [Prevotellaceae bacterium]